MMSWKFGAAQADITPDRPVWMSGMGYRTHENTGVYGPLKACALYMSDGKSQAVLLNADIIDFPSDTVARLRGALADAAGIPGDHVICSATHSHDTPRLSDAIGILGEVDEEYKAWMESTLLRIALEAKKSARAGRLAFSRVRAKVGVNRRKWDEKAGEAVHGPNPEGMHDRAVDTLYITDRQGRDIATMTTYGCHATACGQYELGGDFPGFFRQVMSSRTKAPALWCAGCGGNIRPWLTGTLESFGGATADAAREMGTVHAKNVLSGRKSALPVDASALRVTRKVIRLPLQERRSYKEFRDLGYGEYYIDLYGEAFVKAAWDVARTRKTVPFEIQVLSLNPGHHLVYWSGEVVTDIGIALKDLCPAQIVTPHGYANGSVGYIPARLHYAQGGYEPDRSTVFYKLPAPFAPDIEDRILKATLKIIAAHHA